MFSIYLLILLKSSFEEKKNLSKGSVGGDGSTAPSTLPCLFHYQVSPFHTGTNNEYRAVDKDNGPFLSLKFLHSG